MSRIFKPKQVLAGSFLYKKWGDWKAGDWFCGEYQGQSETPDKYKHFSSRFKVLDSNCLEVGKVYQLNYNTALDKAVEKITVGDVIELRYGGKSTISKGPNAGSEYHSLEIDLMEEADESDSMDL